MHFVDADGCRDREQQRAEQHDRRNAFQHAAEHDERDDRDGQETCTRRRAAAHRRASDAKSPIASAPSPCPCRSDDEKDRARERSRIDQHRIDAPTNRSGGRSGARRGSHRRCRWSRPRLRWRRPDHGGADQERQRQGRQRYHEGAADLTALAKRLTGARSSCAERCEPGDRRARARAPWPGSKPPVNKAAIETPVAEPMAISTIDGGMVSVMPPVAGEQRNHLAGVDAALLHLGKQHRARRPPCPPPSSRKSRTPDTSRRAEHSAVRRGRARATPRGKATMAWAMPVISIRPAKKHEQRHRQQDQGTHPLIHRPKGSRAAARVDSDDKAKRRKAEGEADRNSGEHTERRAAPRRRSSRFQIAEADARTGRKPEQHGRERRLRRAETAETCAVPNLREPNAARTAASAPSPPAAPPRADMSEMPQRRRRDRYLFAACSPMPAAHQQGTKRRASPPLRSIAMSPAAAPASCRRGSCACARRGANAITAPSMASHRNRIAASSSDQTSGGFNTKRAITPASRMTISAAPATRPSFHAPPRARAQTCRPPNDRLPLRPEQRSAAIAAPGRCSPARRRNSRELPRPGRRTSFPGGIEAGARSASRNCDGSGIVEHETLVRRSCCSVALSEATSSRLSNAAALSSVRRWSADLPAAVPGGPVRERPESIPHMVGQRAVLLHLVQFAVEMMASGFSCPSTILVCSDE